MRISRVVSLAIVATLGFSTAALAVDVDFQTFNIRNNNSSITAPWDSDMSIIENAAGTGFTANTPRSGQKVGYGTSYFDGIQLNDIQTVNYDKVSGKAGILAYLNFWVTDGTHYAIISSENQYLGTDFATRNEWKVFETDTTNLNWLLTSGTASVNNQYLQKDGANVTFSDFANNVVLGSPAFPGTYPFINTGAPRANYGLNVIFGDTQSNFIGSFELENLKVKVNDVWYTAKNPAAVPVPAAAWTGLALLGGLAIRRIRKSA